MATRIRAFDWSTTPLGPIAYWPQSLKTTVDNMLGSGQAMMLAWGPERTILYNDAYAPMMGDWHPTGFARPLRHAWPDVWDNIAPLVDQVFRGETVRFENMPLTTTRHGKPEQSWWTFSYSPVRNDAGEIAGLLNVPVDTTAQLRAEVALRESEAQYRLLFNGMDDGFCVIEVLFDENDRPFDYVFLKVNPSFERQTGLHDPIGRTMLSMAPQHEPFWIETYGRIARTGRSEQFDNRADALGRWYEVNASPIGDLGQNQVAVVFRDVLQRRKAEEALRERDERQELLLKLSDAVRTLADPADIQGETTRLLREQLDAAWCYYVDWDLSKKVGLVLRDSAGGGLASLAGEHDVSDAQEFLQLLAKGAVLTVRDYANYDQLPTRIRQKFTALGFRSMMVAPLVKEGRLIATLIVGDTKVRDWSANEAALIVEVAERTWSAIEWGRAEAALRQSETKYRSLFDNMNDGLAVCRVLRDNTGQVIDLVYLEVNEAVERQTGVDRATFVGHRLSELSTEADFARWMPIHRQVADTGHLVTVEDCPDSTNRWYEISVYRSAEDEISMFVRDIDERKRSEVLLREREADLARVQRIGEVGGLDIDVAHGLRSIRSPEYLRLHGLPQDGREESHADWLARLHPDDRDQAERALFEALEGEAASYDGEYRIVRPSDGEVRWIHARADIERDADGNAMRLVGAHTDVTEYRRSTEALRVSEARLAAAFQSVPAGVAVIDTSGRAILSNAEFRRFLPNGIVPSRDAPSSARWRAWDGHGRLLEPHEWPSARALRGETAVPGQEMLFIDESGREIWTTVATAPTRDSDGNVTGFVSVIGDIDVAKRAQNALRQSEARLANDLEATRVLQDIGNRLNSKPGVNGHFIELCEAARALMRSDCASIQVYDERSSRLKLVGHDGFHPASAAFWEWVDADVGSSSGRAMAKGERVIVPDIELFEADQADLEAYRRSAIFSVQSTPLVARNGQVVGMMSTHWHQRDFPAQASYRFFDILARLAADFIVRIRAEEKLRDSERFSRALIEGVPQLVWRAVDHGHWTWASPQWTAFTGQTNEDSHGWGWLDPVHPDDRDGVREIWDGATERGEFHADYRIFHQTEERYRWFQTRATPVHDDAGRIVEWLGTSTDVDDLRGLQERQQVLVAELQHRTRNLIGVVRSTANRTGETSKNFADFKDRFRDRLEALARVQGLLSRLNETDRIAFDELIQTEIAAMHGSTERVTLDGPSGIRLRSSMVQTLALALHELATNAVKYGALGQSDGHLAISWRMAEPDRRGRPRLHIEWRESGVKMPSPGSSPQGGGQGRELIEQALPYQLSAETSFRLGPDGVHCTITIPVSASRATENPDD